MNWKNRLTNYNFWISIFSAVLLILQAFKIEFDIAYVNEIFTAVLGLLVVIGIISDPTRTTIKSDSTKQETKTETIKEEPSPHILPALIL
jgi:phi LC3 family holin